MEPIELQVLAVNKSHELANKLFPLFKEALAPFVGKKIELATGGLTKKVKDALPELPNEHNYRAYIQCQVYSLIVNCNASAQCKNKVEWKSDELQSNSYSLYVAHTSNGVLESFYDFEPLRTDYTVEEVQRLRADYKAKKQAADTAYSALYPFGEYTR